MFRSENKLWRKINCSGNTQEWNAEKICWRRKLCTKSRNIANNRIGNKTGGRRKDTKYIMKRWTGDEIYWLWKYSRKKYAEGQHTKEDWNVKGKGFAQGIIRREGKYSGVEHWGIIHWKIKRSKYKRHSEVEDILKEHRFRRKKALWRIRSYYIENTQNWC